MAKKKKKAQRKKAQKKKRIVKKSEPVTISVGGVKVTVNGKKAKIVLPKGMSVDIRSGRAAA